MEEKLTEYSCILLCIGMGDEYQEFGIECLVVTLMNNEEN